MQTWRPGKLGCKRGDLLSPVQVEELVGGTWTRRRGHTCADCSTWGWGGRGVLKGAAESSGEQVIPWAPPTLTISSDGTTPRGPTSRHHPSGGRALAYELWGTQTSVPVPFYSALITVAYLLHTLPVRLMEKGSSSL